jgi:hypothetical protein
VRGARLERASTSADTAISVPRLSSRDSWEKRDDISGGERRIDAVEVAHVLPVDEYIQVTPDCARFVTEVAIKPRLAPF